MIEVNMTLDDAIDKINELTSKLMDEQLEQLVGIIKNIQIKFFVDISSSVINRNRAIAEYNGINVGELIGSPNMEKLESYYFQMVIGEIVKEANLKNILLNEKDVLALIICSQHYNS